MTSSGPSLEASSNLRGFFENSRTRRDWPILVVCQLRLLLLGSASTGDDRRQRQRSVRLLVEYPHLGAFAASCRLSRSNHIDGKPAYITKCLKNVRTLS